MQDFCDICLFLALKLNLSFRYFCSLLKCLTVLAHLRASRLLPAEWEQLDGRLVFLPLHSPVKIYCDSLPRDLPFLVGLPSFPTSRWLDPSHQISVCPDMKFLRFYHGSSDVCKNHFAQSWIKARKTETKDPKDALFCLVSSAFTQGRSHCPANRTSAAPGTPGRDCRACGYTIPAAFGQTY